MGTGTNVIDEASLELALKNSNPADSLKQKVGLTFQCTGLPNMDKDSKTDVYCVVYDLSKGG